MFGLQISTTNRCISQLGPIVLMCKIYESQFFLVPGKGRTSKEPGLSLYLFMTVFLTMIYYIIATYPVFEKL